MIITFKGFDSVKVGRKIEQPSQELVKNTLSLWQADLDTAIKYGGDLTREAIAAMDIKGDKKYVLVDTKVHMLMPGQCPAIPGWHTDGVPRFVESIEEKYSPLGTGPPNLQIQKEWEEKGDTPRFHLLVTGEGCLTQFPHEQVTLSNLPNAPTNNFYKVVTKDMRNYSFRFPHKESPSCTAIEWDWWHLHSAKLATKREFRFLIRVTESNYHAPQPVNKLNDIIRTQQMVYTPMEFGW